MEKKYLIDKKKTVQDALAILNNIKPKIVFVMSGNELVGSLTDGDVRRFLLKGGKIEDSVVEACNRKIKTAKTKAKADEILKKGYTAVPIVEENRLLDLHFSDKKTSKGKKINVPVVINAGGKGTRLEPFTKVLPKPLIPIGDFPIIEHIMIRFKNFGCNRFYSIVNYKKELIKTYFKEVDKKYDITFLEEKEPLGTVGGLSLLKKQIDKTFFFVNCDTLITSDYSKILDFHKKSKSDITIVCAKKNISIPFGVVEINEDSTLQKIREKPDISFLTVTGLYVLEPSVLNDIENGKFLDMPDFIKTEEKNNKKISVFSVEEDEWMDMGEFPELEKTRRKLLAE